MSRDHFDGGWLGIVLPSLCAWDRAQRHCRYRSRLPTGREEIECIGRMQRCCQERPYGTDGPGSLGRSRATPDEQPCWVSSRPHQRPPAPSHLQLSASAAGPLRGHQAGYLTTQYIRASLCFSSSHRRTARTDGQTLEPRPNAGMGNWGRS